MTNGLYYAQPIILASGSQARRELLESAKLIFDVCPCQMDEEDVKKEIRAENPDISPFDMAVKLASAKAQAVSVANPEKLTIGGDQICELNGRILTKATEREQAIAKLKEMRGATHFLHSAVALAINGHVLWNYGETASLRMLNIKDAAIASYVDTEMPFSSIGCYFFESMGRHLFAEISGSTECIMGMPLNPLICAMHDMGFIEYRGV